VVLTPPGGAVSPVLLATVHRPPYFVALPTCGVVAPGRVSGSLLLCWRVANPRLTYPKESGVLPNVRLLALGSVAAMVAACGGSSSPTPTPHTGGATPTPTATPGGGATQPTPGPLDPCTLFTQQQASTLAGTAVAAGVSGSAAAVRTCDFNGGSVFVVLGLVQAADMATAQAYKSQAEAPILPRASSHVSLPTFANGAEIIRIARAGVTVNAIYVVDGTNFFSIACTNASPSDNALKFAATLIIGALP
jgi:hypothetical protein